MLIGRRFRIWISKEISLENEVGRAYYHTWEERIPPFRFRLYRLFSCLCFTRRGWLRDSPPKKPRVAIPVYWVVLHWYASDADGRSVGWSVGRTVTWLQKFLEWVDYRIFLSMGPRYSWFSLWRHHIVKLK